MAQRGLGQRHGILSGCSALRDPTKPSPRDKHGNLETEELAKREGSTILPRTLWRPW